MSVLHCAHVIYLIGLCLCVSLEVVQSWCEHEIVPFCVSACFFQFEYNFLANALFVFLSVRFLVPRSKVRSLVL